MGDPCELAQNLFHVNLAMNNKRFDGTMFGQTRFVRPQVYGKRENNSGFYKTHFGFHKASACSSLPIGTQIAATLSLETMVRGSIPKALHMSVTMVGQQEEEEEC